MYFKNPKEGKSATLLSCHIPAQTNWDEHTPPDPMATKYFPDSTKKLHVYFFRCSLSNCFNIQRMQCMHILPFLGSTTSSILGTGVGSSMSFVRSSCSSSSFWPLLFPYKAACLEQITHKVSASCNHQMCSSWRYSSDSRIKGTG